MIQQLIRYYDNFMPEKAKVPYGYSDKEVSFSVDIDADGNIMSVNGQFYTNLLDDEGKGKQFRLPDDYVPDNGFLPRFLYGRAGYIFHLKDKKGKYTWFDGQQELHKKILETLAGDGYLPALAVLRFFEKESLMEYSLSEEEKSELNDLGKNMKDYGSVFALLCHFRRLSGNLHVFTKEEVIKAASGIFAFYFNGSYLFNDDKFKYEWEESLRNGRMGRSAFSLDDGLILFDPHPKFGSSVVPGTGAGGTLISRKKEIDAFQMELPLPSITRQDVYKYKSALSYLMTEKEKRRAKEKKSGNIQKDKNAKEGKKVSAQETEDIKPAEDKTYTHYFFRTKLTEDLTILHWTESGGSFDSEFILETGLGDLLPKLPSDDKNIGDDELKEIFDRACKGIGFKFNEQDPVVHIYGILGQQGRIRILFSSDVFLNELLVNSLAHQKRVRLIGLEAGASVFSLLQAVLPDGSSLKQYQKIAQDMVLSVMLGTNYPAPLFTMAIERMKNAIVTGKFGFSGYTARCVIALLKAIMLKNYNMEVSEKMDVLKKDTAYLLGRVYAAAWLTVKRDHQENMDKVMQRWYRVAMETPSLAYAPYLQSARIHEANDYKIAEIMREISEPLPERLNVKEQSLWVLGFYHQFAEYFKIGAPKEDKSGKDEKNVPAGPSGDEEPVVESLGNAEHVKNKDNVVKGEK